jgi:uncharacterized protein (DUF2252 family)
MSELSDKIKAFDTGLLPDMLQLKYEAMTENAFRYYRGTCRLFYDDLVKVKGFPKSPAAWICGDLHLENFGSYRGNNKLVYFDLNDFDEAALAPAAWEIVRLVASIFIAFDALKFEDEKALKMGQLFLKTYADTLSKGKATSIEPRTAKGIICDFLTSAEQAGQKEILEKRTIKKEKELALSLKDERHFKLNKHLRNRLTEHINAWVKNSSDGPYNYKVKSAVFRLAGTGSLGLKRYLFLLKSTNTKNKYLLLDMKQARVSAPQMYLGKVKQPQWQSEAVRVTTIQERMQYVPPSLLSTTIFDGEPFIIQELQPVKDNINFKRLNDYRDMYQVIDDMAMLTASSQLRSGGIQGSANIDALMAFGANLDWQQPILDYAMAYATQIKGDYRCFMRDFKNGVFKTY